MGVTDWSLFLSGINDDSVGTRRWELSNGIDTSPRITARDDFGALCQFDTAASATGTRYSAGLRGVGIPPVLGLNYQLTGIEARIRKRMDVAAVYDHVVSLVWDGALIGENKAAAGIWPASYTDAIYGGATDLWGAGLRLGEILQAPEKLGLQLEIRLVDSSSSTLTYASVDSMELRFHFDKAGLLLAF